MTVVVDVDLADAAALGDDAEVDAEVLVQWKDRAKEGGDDEKENGDVDIAVFSVQGLRGTPIPARTGLEHVNLAAAVRRRLAGLWIAPQSTYVVHVLGVPLVLTATEASPAAGGFLAMSSDVRIEDEARGQGGPDAVFGDVMKQLLADLEEMVSLGAKGHDMAPRGALLCGPLGAGKSFCLAQLRERLLSATATSKDSPAVDVTSVDCASLLLEAGRSKLPGRVGPRAAGLHVILVDDIDALVSLRDDEAREGRSRVVDWLCGLLQRKPRATSRVFVLGTCADACVSQLPTRLVAPSSATAFPLRLAIDVPSREERVLLARDFLRMSLHPAASDADAVADCTVGFVAGDFAQLVAGGDPNQESPEALLARAAAAKPRALAQAGDIQEAQRAAAAMPEAAGYTAVRERLQQLVQWQWLHPEASGRLGAQAPTGILLHGPSGCGKTLLAHKIGQLAACNFVSVKSSDLVSKYVGESERLIRDLFARARRAAPCILFFDELDSIATRRDLGSGGAQQTSVASNRVLATFLNELDGIDTQHGLLVLGACSRADALDAALLRPGRLGTAIHVPMPSAEDRLAIFQTMRTPWAPEVDLDALVREMDGLSCADVRAVNTEAIFAAMRESSDPGNPSALVVTRAHLDFALQRVGALTRHS